MDGESRSKARGCAVMFADGIMTITGTSDAPFLGFPAGKIARPTTVTLRVKAAKGGDGKVEALSAPNMPDTAGAVALKLAADQWQEISVKLEVEGSLGIVRVYLPAQSQPVSVDWIEVGGKNETRRWEW